MDFTTKDKLYQFAPITTEKEKKDEKEADKLEGFKQDQKLRNQEQAMTFSSMMQLYSSQIENKDYLYKDGSSSKKATRETRPNSSMSRVLSGLQTLNSLLDSPMGQVDLKDEQSILAAQKPFLDVCAACRTYLKNHRKKPWTAEGKARRQMVEDILKQAEKESVALYQRLKSYGEKENPDIPKLDKWKDVVEDIRTEEIKGKEVGIGGEGTSTINILEVANESGKVETKYFKEAEDTPSTDYRENVQRKLDKLSISENDETASKEVREESKKLKALLSHVFTAMKKMGSDNLLGNFRKAQNPAKLLEYLRYDMSDKTLDVLDKAEKDIAVYKKLQDLIWSIRQDCFMGDVAQSEAKIGKDSSITKRNAATSRLADILGVSDMVVKSSMAKVDINGQKKYGLLMDKAEGKDMKTTDKKLRKANGSVEYTESAYRQLMNLQIFDTICAQVDRNIGNYMVKGDGEINKKIDKITAIDNDLSFGKLKFKDVAPGGRISHFNMTKITDNAGALGMPVIDAEFAEKILAVTEEQIRYQMVDLLDHDELDALVDRIKGVQGLLRNAKEQRPDSFISGKDEKAWEKAMKDFESKLNSMNEEEALDMVLHHTYFSPLAFSKTRKIYTQRVRD